MTQRTLQEKVKILFRNFIGWNGICNHPVFSEVWSVDYSGSVKSKVSRLIADLLNKKIPHFNKIPRYTLYIAAWETNDIPWFFKKKNLRFLSRGEMLCSRSHRDFSGRGRTRNWSFGLCFIISSYSLLLFTMLSMCLLKFVYVIHLFVSQVFSSNFKGMVSSLFIRSILHWDKLLLLYGSRWVFRVSFNCQRFEYLTPWNLLKYPWRLVFIPYKLAVTRPKWNHWLEDDWEAQWISGQRLRHQHLPYPSLPFVFWVLLWLCSHSL